MKVRPIFLPAFSSAVLHVAHILACSYSARRGWRWAPSSRRMVSRGKAILEILRRTTFTPETIQQIIAKPLPPPHLTYPHLYYKPFTRYAAERQGTFDRAWEPQRFPFLPERLPQLPEIQEPAISERVFTHLSARTKGATRGCTHEQWMGSYKRYEGLGDVVINHAAWLAAEKSRTKDVSRVIAEEEAGRFPSSMRYS